MGCQCQPEFIVVPGYSIIGKSVILFVNVNYLQIQVDDINADRQVIIMFSGLS